ncbi:hypothetical protein [Streptomyces sp. CBMA156]|uniref:hypothetical protein n=1 Tax=Streptomyces sp. CBMA156 TaxID=1930280 RepID=UPI001661E6A6|nr:hypothetical protein [Streptomyces sp. CBMA156]MBD0669194.1 hypothetical protein [Streptomyces sp. CBMA156]
MSPKRIAAVAAGIAGAVVLATVAYAGAPVTLNMATGSADCTVSWTKDGVTFKPLTPGSSASAFLDKDATGTVTIDLTAVGNPVTLANSVYIRTAAKGGFSLTDASGHYVQATNLEGSLSGDSTFVVQTSSDPAGTRIPVYDIPTRPQITPDVQSLVPPRVDLALSDIRMIVLPEFATVMNQTFGDGTIQPGDQLGTCTAQTTS